jgi:hypothetical protein
MASVTRTGVALGLLYELDTNFEKVVSDLKLESMSSDDKARIRGKLAEVIGRGLKRIESSKKLNPTSRLQSKAIIATLKAAARNLEQANSTLQGLQTGLQESYQIDAAIRIRQVLAENAKLKSSADKYLRDFCDRLNTVSQACLVAAKNVKLTKRKSGQKPLDWYDEFTRIVMLIARKNNIRTTFLTDRDSNKKSGRFLDLAEGFENLLYPTMRSPSRGALAKRLSRSLARIK